MKTGDGGSRGRARPRLRSSLVWTFAGILLAVLVLGGLLQGLVTAAVVRPVTRLWMQNVSEIAARDAADSIGRSLEADPHAPVGDLLRQASRGQRGLVLFYRDTEGTIQSFDRLPPRGRERPGPRRRSMARPDPEEFLVAAARRPVEVSGVPAGEIVAGFRRGMAARLPGGPPRLLYFIPVAALAAGVAGLVLVRLLARRLRRLEVQAVRISEGDFSARITRPATDEIGRLEESLNRMAVSLEAARTKVEETELQRRRFLADVTHELSTPLTIIRGYAETMLDSGVAVADAERETYLNDILDAARRMDLLVRDLLDLARLESGVGELELVALDLSGLLQGSLRRLQPLLHEAGLTVEWSGPASPVMVRADGRRLEQVFDNLIINTIRYVPRGGRVKVTLEKRERVKLTVEDNGPGIPEPDLEHVFDRFYRADPSRSSAGTGLGLAIVREIVRRHGGSVSAGRSAEGGARLIVEL